MSKFGKIAKTKYVTKTEAKEVYVKGWRAKLAEKLLGKDIEDLETFLRQQLEDDFSKEVRKESEILVQRWWKNYQYQLDDEILDIFPDYEPFLSFRPYDSKDDVLDVNEPTYKKVRINGQYVAFIPRFKKKPKLSKKGEK